MFITFLFWCFGNFAPFQVWPTSNGIPAYMSQKRAYCFLTEELRTEKSGRPMINGGQNQDLNWVNVFPGGLTYHLIYQDLKVKFEMSTTCII